MTPSTLALQRAVLRARKLIVDWSGRSGQTYFHHRVAEYHDMWRAVAQSMGGTFTELSDDIWQIEVDGTAVRLHNHQIELDNPVVLGLAGNKAVVHRLLAADGLAIPDHALFSLGQLERAEDFLRRHPSGCVVKPVNGYGGQGVTTHVMRRRELRRAALLASLYDRNLLIEAQVPGESYRLLVLEGRVIHAVARRGPRLLGDGRSTIRELIDARNVERRGTGEPAIDVDRDCLFTLAQQGLTVTSVPAAGSAVIVKSVNDPRRKYREVRTVYTDTVTDLVCPSVRQAAERAARIVGSDFLGVDIIAPDVTTPLERSGGAINEVNTTPALHHHYDPTREACPEVAVQVARAALRRKLSARAPAG